MAATRSEGPSFAAAWPLTGRDDELRVLQRVLTDRRPRSVVLVGPAGVGKTRLAREAQAIAERSTRTTRWVTATHSVARSPLGAFATLLPAADSSGPDTVQDLLRRYAKVLVRLGEGRPLVLFVDDAQLLDEISAGLIHQLVATDTVSVVLTVRAGEPVPAALTELWKDELAVRLDLARLDTTQVANLLAAALGGQVDPAAVVELAEHSGGNVLFLRELVLAAMTDANLTRDMGVWRLRGPLAPSDRIVELVAGRVRDLDPDSLALLQLAAYAEPLGTREIGASTSLVEALERQGLLTSNFDGRRLQVRLAHPLYADVLRLTTSAVRTAAMGRTMAAGAESTGGRRRDDALRIGIWWMDGGGGGSPQLLLRAAEAARGRYDFALAERLAQAAVDAGAGFPARLLAAHTLALQGRPADALEPLRLLTELARDDAERVELAIVHIDTLWVYLGRPLDGLRVATAAEASITDPALRAQVAARRTGLELIADGPGPAALSALAHLEAADPRAASWLYLVAAYGLGRLGRIAEALDVADRGYAATCSLEPGDWPAWYFNYTRCENLAHAGRFAQARALAREQYHQGLSDGSSEERAYFLWHQARPVRELGHVLEAAPYAREAVTLLRRLARVGFEHSLLSTLAITLALGGDYQAANLALVAADELGVDQPQWSATDHLAARGWTAVAEGRLTAGRTALLEAAAVGEGIGDLMGTLAALHDVARLGGARDVLSRIREAAAGAEGELTPARVAHVQALADRDPVALAAAATRFEELGAALLAAEAAADTAVAWRRAAQTARSDSELHRAAALARACPGAATPALSPIESREQLTGAERETALLAAAGRTNREIAAELHLSVRTVDNRLQRVYTKLGISRRADLADLVR